MKRAVLDARAFMCPDVFKNCAVGYQFLQRQVKPAMGASRIEDYDDSLIPKLPGVGEEVADGMQDPKRTPAQ